MRAFPFVLGSILLLATLAACRGPGGEARFDPKDRPAGIVFSPNGEPLTGGPLGTAKCDEAIARWFSRLDGKGAGWIDRDLFIADAKDQFAKMDSRHWGYLTANDLSEYRAPFEPPAGPEHDLADRLQPTGMSAGGQRRRPATDMVGTPNSWRGPLVDTRADPVMSADKTLRFKVTLEDFVIHAGEVFADLDKDHDGHLTSAEATAFCPVAQRQNR